MQASFPALTYLELALDFSDLSKDSPVFPRGFLGGSAPSLQHLCLKGISFSKLPTLLLSARDLVSLEVEDIPSTRYISPRAMVRGLAGLARLRDLCLGFGCDTETLPDHWQARWRLDPPIQATLPSLTHFHYRGYSTFLEELVAQINSPRVVDVRIGYTMQQAQVPQLSLFIGRTTTLKLVQCRRAILTFSLEHAYIEFFDLQKERTLTCLSLTILGRSLALQVQFIAHFLGQLVTVLSNVCYLTVRREFFQIGREHDEDTEWLPLLHVFSAVEVLHVTGGLAGHIGSALEDISQEELPSLHLLWLDDDYDGDDEKPVGSTERFFYLRQLSDRPVTIVNSRDEFIERFRLHQRHSEKVLSPPLAW